MQGQISSQNFILKVEKGWLGGRALTNHVCDFIQFPDRNYFKKNKNKINLSNFT